MDTGAFSAGLAIVTIGYFLLKKGKKKHKKKEMYSATQTPVVQELPNANYPKAFLRGGQDTRGS